MPQTTAFRRRRLFLAIFALPLVASLTLASCATAEQETASDDTATVSNDRFDAELYAAAVKAATEFAGSDDLGGSVEVLGGNTGEEGAIMEGLYGAFGEGAGVKINYTGTGSNAESTSTVASRVAGGNAPDIAELSLGAAAPYAADGQLADLSALIGDDELSANYSQPLLDSASSDGKVFGIYQGFSTFPFWYNPEQYTGPTGDDVTWQAVTDWTTTEADGGTPVWCMGLEAGAGTGFPAAQVLEVLFAKKYGPELLAQWGSGELPWTSPEVKDSFNMFGTIANEKTIDGGVAGALSQSVTDGPLGLVSDPASCQADIWGSWVPGVIGDAAVPETNIDFMPVPGSAPEFANTEIFQANVMVQFNQNERTDAFMKFIASAPAQALLASADQWTVADTQVPVDTYSSPLLQKAAEYYFSDDAILATGPNVLADAATASAFNAAIVAYLQNPDDLDSILDTVEKAAQG